MENVMGVVNEGPGDCLMFLIDGQKSRLAFAIHAEEADEFIKKLQELLHPVEGPKR